MLCFSYMTDAGGLPIPEEKGRNLGALTLIAVVVAIVVCALWYWLVPSSFPLGARDASGSYVLLLNKTVNDAQGLPYVGAVLYDAASGSYSYIATNDEGAVTPVGPSAFSGTQYLAVRSGAESNDVVVYDRAMLSLVRVVQASSLGETISSAVWAPDGQTFAYLVIGGESPALMTAAVAESSPEKSPWFGEPLGFSPDSSKLLVHVTPAPIMVNLADNAGMQTSGITVEEGADLILSPSGKYLVAISNTTAEWYAVDWNTATLTALGRTTLKAAAADVLFASDDTLAVRAEGSDVLRTYTYAEDRGVKKGSSLKLSLPEGARVLSIASW